MDPLTSLPRGPHALTRQTVVNSQRARLLRAVAEATAERGYAATSVADILSRAHVSRDTFYQLFDSKQGCFIAAYEQAAATLLGVLKAKLADEGPLLERLDAAIGIYLSALVAEPEYARLFMVEVYAAGEEALARRADVQNRFESLVIASLGAEQDEDLAFSARTVVAAVIQMVTARLAARDLDGITALAQPLSNLVATLLA